MLDDLPQPLLGLIITYLAVDEVFIDGAPGSATRSLRRARLSPAYLSSITYLRLATIPPPLLASIISLPRLTSIFVDASLSVYARDRSLRQIGRVSPRLANIAFAPYCRITSATLLIVRSVAGIESLTLAHCDINDSHLAILSRFRRLRELDLTGCSRVTDAGIGALAQGGAPLQILIAAGCWRLTDNTIEHLADRQAPMSPGGSDQHLRVLDVSQTLISDAGLELVADRGPMIVGTLLVDHCLRVTVNAIDRLLAARGHTGLIVHHAFAPAG